MTRKRFLPGFDTAPGPHRALVQNPERQGDIRYAVRRPDPYLYIAPAQRELAQRRALARSFGGITLKPPPPIEAAGTASQGWRLLREGAMAWLLDHLDGVHINPYHSALNEQRTKSHTDVAGKDGLATDIAFLEVIPKALFRREFADPNAQIAAWAHSSVGFMVEWLGLYDPVDKALTWALARPKPRHPAMVFEDLHFDPKWFTADEALRHVGLDPNRVHNLRDEHNRHPRHYESLSPLFGCPAAKIVPAMHMHMVDQAEAAGLFGRTYLEERANHGYPEAWAALGNLTIVE